MKNTNSFLKNKTILITGGTGTFGKAAIKKLLKLNLKKIIIFSRDELKQFELKNKYQAVKNLRFFLGDIRDTERCIAALNGVDYCIHAAALKQVESGEYNPFEVVKTNIIGTQNVIQACIYSKVKKVILVSSDKAVHPVNLYGTTKLAADKLFVAANNLTGNKLINFSVVRYGNVLGSRGSVLEIFKKNLNDKTGFFNITDKKMTRFWLKIEDGVEFVINSMRLMQGGEIFIPKIPTIKVTDIASCLNKKYKIKVVGIRPGEKLHEVMCPKEEAMNTLEFKKFYIIKPTILFSKKRNYSKLISGEIGSKVNDDFEYRSDTNKKYLNNSEIKKFILN